MKKLFGFGEKVKGYDVAVLNEREIRAAAGLLFLASFYSFMNVWLIGNYFPIKVFISGFFIDFIIRLFINPKFSPSLIIGRWIVRNQKVEYTGAPQKKFAWTIGIAISAFMFFTLVILNQATLLTCILCIICLIFLFCETAFGICIGCMMYNLVNKEKAHYCPGGVCEIHQKEPIQNISLIQIIIVVAAAISLLLWTKTPWLQLTQSSVNGYNCAISKMGMHRQNSGVNSCNPVAPITE